LHCKKIVDVTKILKRAKGEEKQCIKFEEKNNTIINKNSIRFSVRFLLLLYYSNFILNHDLLSDQEWQTLKSQKREEKKVLCSKFIFSPFRLRRLD
jgi:hypothetical protein